MRWKNKGKRICSFLLAAAMVFGSMFMNVSAEAAGTDSGYVKLSQTELVLTNATSEGQLSATVVNGTAAAVTWKSSDTSVASVSDGVVTAQGNGTAIITASAASASSASCTVTVSGYGESTTTVTQENVISQTENSVTIGVESISTGGLFITSDMSKTSFTSVGYAGDMPVVNGKAQYTINKVPVKEGAGFTTEDLSEGDQFKYWVRVNTAEGQVMKGPFEYTHKLAGNVAVTGITIKPVTSVVLKAGDIYQLSGSIAPSDATETDVTWTSSNAGVVSVGGSKGGLLTAVAAGTATVTVKTKEGGYSASCQVTVTADTTEETEESTETSGSTEDSGSTGGSGSAATSVKISQDTMQLTNATRTGTLKVTAGTATGVTSSNTEVATAALSGKYITIKAVGDGTAVITVQSASGSVQCTVTVNGTPETVENDSVVQSHIMAQAADGSSVTLGNGKTGVFFATSDLTRKATEGDGKPTLAGYTLTASGYEVKYMPNEQGQLTGNLAALKKGDKFAYFFLTNGVMEGPFIYINGAAASDVAGIEVVPVSSLKIEIGDIYQLGANVLPADAGNLNVTWTSSSDAVATVNAGLVTGISRGMATITATTEEGKKIAACTVQVGADVAATKVTLSKTTVQIPVGLGKLITASVLPENATNTSIVWKSADTSIAVVNGGVITGVKEGSTTVTATVEGTGISAACRVTITKAVTAGDGNTDGYVNTGEDGNAPPVSMGYHKPEIDESLQSDETFMYFTLSNNTNGKYADDQVYVTILGREWTDNDVEPFSYLTASGQLQLVSTRTNDKYKMMYNPWSGLVDTKREYTNLGFTIADLKALGQIDSNGNAYVKIPPIRSGRMYVSYGEDICIEIKGADFAGPALENPTDPNHGIVFDFVEFTYNNLDQFWGNTTRVDGYVFPISIRLTGTDDALDEDGNVIWENGVAKQVPADKWAGDIGTLEQIYERWDYETREGTLFEKFNHLLVRDDEGNPERIKAPGKGEFDSEGEGIYTDYYDEYVNYVWNMYTNPYNPDNPMVFTTQAGRFVQTGIASSAPGCNGKYALEDGSPLMVFKHEVWNKDTGSWYEPYPDRRYYIHKPSTGEVFEGKGAFDHHHDQGYQVEWNGGLYPDTNDLVIQSQLCAAFNRGVAHFNESVDDIYSTDPNDPTGINSNGNPIAPWGDVSKYYVVDDVNKGVFNFYAKFWHEFGVDGKAYGYCYDDVWEQSTLLYARYANVLAIDFYSYGGVQDDTDTEEPVIPEDPDIWAATKVTGVTAAYANGSVTVTWDDCKADGYMVARSDGRSSYTYLTYRATEAGWTDSDVIKGQLYYYRIIPYFYASDGTTVSGVLSDAAGVLAADKLPDKVTGVTAQVSGKTVVLNWDSADTARYYKIARASGSTGQYYCLKYNVMNTTYTDSGVSAGTYRYKVVGYYKKLDGSWEYGAMCDTLYVTVK